MSACDRIGSKCANFAFRPIEACWNLPSKPILIPLFTGQQCKRMDKQAFDAWKNKLIATVRAKMNQIFRQDAEIPYHTYLSKKGLDQLAGIHEYMVVTYADKSAHDFVTCCKHVYRKMLWEELHDPHYENSPLSSDDIFAKHTSLSTQIGRPSIQSHRYLYGILKMHKAKVGMRSSPATTSRQLMVLQSKVTSKKCQLVLLATC